MRINPAALRSVRERAGLSQNGLAKRSTVDQSHISLIEREPARAIRPETAKKLADALNVEITDIAVLTDEEAVGS